MSLTRFLLLFLMFGIVRIMCTGETLIDISAILSADTRFGIPSDQLFEMSICFHNDSHKPLCDRGRTETVNSILHRQFNFPTIIRPSEEMNPVFYHVFVTSDKGIMMNIPAGFRRHNMNGQGTYTTNVAHKYRLEGSPEEFFFVFSANFTFSCVNDFYGPTCGTYCPPPKDNERYYCNRETGERVCKKGYAGADCTVNTCGGCRHGVCLGPNQCRCDPFWYGPLCNRCNRSETCSNGYCSKGNDCVCESGFIGTDCDTREACKYMLCGNHGTCTHKSDQPLCVCSEGWTGKYCAMKIEKNLTLMAALTTGTSMIVALVLLFLAAIGIIAICRKCNTDKLAVDHTRSYNGVDMDGFCTERSEEEGEQRESYV